MPQVMEADMRKFVLLQQLCEFLRNKIFRMGLAAIPLENKVVVVGLPAKQMTVLIVLHF